MKIKQMYAREGFSSVWLYYFFLFQMTMNVYETTEAVQRTQLASTCQAHLDVCATMASKATESPALVTNLIHMGIKNIM